MQDRPNPEATRPHARSTGKEFVRRQKIKERKIIREILGELPLTARITVLFRWNISSEKLFDYFGQN